MTILVGLLALVPVALLIGLFVFAANESDPVLMAVGPVLLTALAFVAYCVGLVVRPWLVEVLR